MTIRFCTRKDINGNRSFLILSDKAKCYTRVPNTMLTQDDYIEISKHDLKKLQTLLEQNHWTYCDTM